MSADALRARTLAYEAFAARKGGHHADNDFQKFAASPKNYDMLFLENSDAYYFAFRIRRYHGRIPKDGELTFKVDKSSEKVSMTEFPQPASSAWSETSQP